MHKLVVLYPEPTDRKEFVSYYESTHLPLARKLPGLLDLRYSTDIGDSSQTHFAIFEADFLDADAFRRAMGSPEGKAVQKDVPNYATGGAAVLNYTVEEGA